jgi:excisionase family DNA binding protein
MKDYTEERVIVPVGFIRDLQNDIEDLRGMVKDVIKRLEAVKDISRDTKVNQWLSTAEAAKYLGVATRTMSEYGRSGTIPSVKTGKAVKYRARDLEEYMMQNMRMSNRQVEQAALKYKSSRIV